jgi:DNA-binding NarL/FixJ family response regulator
MNGTPEPRTAGILLVTADDPAGTSVLDAFRQRAIEIEWARTLADMRSRAARADLPAPTLVFLDLDLPDVAGGEAVSVVEGTFPGTSVIVLEKPVNPRLVAEIVFRMSSAVRPPGAARARGGWRRHFELVVRAYSAERALSSQQRMVLDLYLGGKNDKEIAEICGCSEATVHEYWRRMARKAGATLKSEVIADFHRFLAGDQS